MERFSGRSSDIVTIPSKPISTGYKVWAIAQLGYILSVLYYRNGKGPVGSKVPLSSRINPTQAVVVTLLKTLPNPPIGPSLQYCVWLDNLFVSTTLFSYLRRLGYSAAGTCRTNSGICQEFVLKKKAEQANQSISRLRSLWQAPTKDNLVLQTAWKDNNLVLFLSTIHYPVELDSEIVRTLQANTEPGNLIGQELIVRNRRRPRATSTAAKSVRAEFGDAVRKNLAIPCVIDEYNHKMGQVDLADQYRADNPGRRRIRRGGWHALWKFIYNTVLVNSYLLSSWVGRREKGSGLDRGQSEFRSKLISQLFELARAEAQKQKRVVSHTNPLRFAAPEQHIRVLRDRKQDCMGCALTGQARKPEKRKALGEISANQGPRKRPRSTVYGCKACDIPLCKEGPCWDEYHKNL